VIEISHLFFRPWMGECREGQDARERRLMKILNSNLAIHGSARAASLEDSLVELK